METAAAQAVSNSPLAQTLRGPKRDISLPVINAGAYMARICHWIPNVAVDRLCP
nr:hypothetical protein [Serratia fonticola]